MAPRKKVPVPRPMPASTQVDKSASLTKEERNRELPKKESDLFRQVLQQYETKQFTLGLTTVEGILNNFPDHGESLAMKGLFLSCTGQKPSGYEHIERAVVLDGASHIVWHVYALILRADKNFQKAMECYQKAVEIEPESLNLLNDLSTLTVHLRHYPEYQSTRISILRSQPRNRRNWVYLAISQHLSGDLVKADETLTHLEGMLREVPDKEYEHSELLMYHAEILDEAKEWERCLEFLGEHSGEIVDRTAYSVLRAHLLLKLGRNEAANWAWELLLEENPDSYEFIKGSVLAKGADCDSTTDEGRAAAVKILDTLSEKYPRSLAIRRLALELVSGDLFRKKASRYLTEALSKGVPSLFADVKSLYADEAKRTTIGELVEQYRTSLESSATFGLPSDAEDEVESSTTYLWTLYFLAQHYSALSSHSTALSLLTLAETHTPSLPELSMLRARILKRAGDAKGAMVSMKEARALDGQDRFLNSKTAKYLIRADEVDEAEKVCGLFTKKDAPSPLEDLVDMQCLWILQEEAESLVRQRKFGLALKRYQQIFQVFTEIEEDQYDFHSYCIRKSTIRAYIKMLRFADHLRSHPRYIAAAKGAIAIYLQIATDPLSVVPPILANGLAEEEATRIAKEVEAHEQRNREIEAKKQVKINEELEKARKAEAKEKGKGKKGTVKKEDVAAAVVEEEEELLPLPMPDLDPRGAQLLATETPLEEAQKFLLPLEKANAGDVATWVLSYQVAMKRGKPLLALRALRTAHSLSPLSPALHPLIVEFAHVTSSATYAASISKTISTHLPTLLGGLSLEEFTTGAEKRLNAGAEGTIAAAKGVAVLRGEQGTEEVEKIVLDGIGEASLKTTLEALTLLTALPSSSPDAVTSFKEIARARFPLARAFMSDEELAAEDAKLAMRESVAGEGKEVVENGEA